MDDANLTIGQVAKRAGFNSSAIRYYEAKGFSLDDIQVLLGAGDAGEPAHARLQDLARRKLPAVDELIDRAQSVRSWLQTATGCGCQTLDLCALFAQEDRLPPEGLRLVSVEPNAAAP
jgi:DNA-binding transcriptional MerR regulator